MSETKILAIKKENIFALSQFVLLVLIASITPLIRSQAITGPIVNAVLFISVILLDTPSAILVGLIPSVVALSTGLLPVPLAPMIPFIMLGNTILIVVFKYLKKRNYWLGVISASVLKFLFLFATSQIVINLVFKKELATKISLMMSYPQLVTALGGGLIAYLFLRRIKKV